MLGGVILGPRMTHFGVIFDPFLGHIWDPYFGPLFTPRAAGGWERPKRGPKRGPKMTQKWVKNDPFWTTF